MPITLPVLCIVTLILCNVHGSLEHEIPRRSFLSRRAIDGTRGRKYFDPEEEGAFDSYGSAGGQYDPYQEKTDLEDIRMNVPGEPGIDYPAYTTLPQTGFTCEGRSRGYYADEVSGCQVFHVCHDVLVSSFLCPIGSIFSQQLLTCDWWTKVDCSSSGKYIDVNRNSYQQDDDEMIRNAYAMISLQSGTDVTEDGLVDPDRTGSVTDYQRNAGRVPDYIRADTTANDLLRDYDDYPRAENRNFLPPHRPKESKIETSRDYQRRFYGEGKSRSPYEDSPIIRIHKLNDPSYEDPRIDKNYPNRYRGPNEFADQFQPSYAPTVPTVTTTTRRFYSPTVPTAFRTSTPAYNKLDQEIDSSDYYFSRSRTKSFVTPPTRVFPDDQDAFKRENFPATVAKKLNDYGRRSNYEDYAEGNNEDRNERVEDGSETPRFQVRVAEVFHPNRTDELSEKSSFLAGYYGGLDQADDEEDLADDFETRGSIGLGQALRKSFGGFSVPEQNPVKDKDKNEEDKVANHRYTLSRSGSVDYPEGSRTGTTEFYEGKSKGRDNSDVSVSATTPSVIESTIKATTSIRLLNDSVGKDYVDRGEDESHTTMSIELPDPPEKPRGRFRIKVPDLSELSALLLRFSTLDDDYFSDSGTTELSSLRNSNSDDYIDRTGSFDEHLTATEDYGGSENFKDSPTTAAGPLISSSGSWLASTSSDRATANSRDSPRDLTKIQDANFHRRDSSSALFESRHKSEAENEGKIGGKYNPSTENPILKPDSGVSVNEGVSPSWSTISTPKSIRVSASSDSSSSSAVEIPKESSNIGRSGSFDEHLTVTEDYGGSENSKHTGFKDSPTTAAGPLISSSGSWLASSNSDRATANSRDGPRDLTKIQDTNFHRRDSSSALFESRHKFSTPKSIRVSASSDSSSSSAAGISKESSNIDRSGSFDEHLTVTEDYGGSENSKHTGFKDSPTTAAGPLISSSGSWLASSNSDRATANSRDGPRDLTKIQDTNFYRRDSSSALFESRHKFSTPKSIRVSASSDSSSSSAAGISKESSSQGLNRTSSAESTLKREKSVGITESKDNTEASTIDSPIETIQPVTSRRVQETTDKYDTPYRVTLAVNKQEELLSTDRDGINKFQGSPTSNDRIPQLKTTKPESEIGDATKSESRKPKAVDIKDDSKSVNDLSSVVDDLKKRKSFSTVSLLQLMSELLKLDKVPRPFSLSVNEDSEIGTRSQHPLTEFSITSDRSIVQGVGFNVELRGEATDKYEESATESGIETPVPELRERILGELQKNFGEPIYREREHPIFDPPAEERSVDSESGLPFKASNTDKGFDIKDDVKERLSDSFGNNSEGKPDTSTQRTVLTTEAEKIVVKTEFVPSIGFSLDTDEGREEYVEAVLGGLIETAETEKKETIFPGKIDAKNETRESVSSGKN